MNGLVKGVKRSGGSDAYDGVVRIFEETEKLIAHRLGGRSIGTNIVAINKVIATRIAGDTGVAVVGNDISGLRSQASDDNISCASVQSNPVAHKYSAIVPVGSTPMKLPSICAPE